MTAARFRDPVARDRAWASHYAKHGLRVPVMTAAKSTPNTYRIANYMIRAANHHAAQLVTSATVRM